MHTMGDAGRTFLILQEAVKLKAYKDSKGVLTIGIGHTSAAGPPKVVPGMAVSSAEAYDIFTRDLVRFETAVARLTADVTPPLQQHEFDALVSLTFNIGEGRKGFAGSSVLRHLKGGDRAKAAQAMLAWNRSGRKVLDGLKNRRARERLLFETGTYTGVKLTDGRR